jgi:hypothetical protein
VVDTVGYQVVGGAAEVALGGAQPVATMPILVEMKPTGLKIMVSTRKFLSEMPSRQTP